MNDLTIYDIIIIGAGPAGMTAAIYAGRANKKVCVIDKGVPGGNILNSPLVENIPGFSEISGEEFANQMEAQLKKLPNVTFIMDTVLKVNMLDNIFTVQLEDGIMLSKTVIIATGTEHKELKLDNPDIPVHYCATCDGFFFKDMNVLVVGSGNTGATYALELATYCKQVYICDIAENMLCEKVLADRLLQAKNIEWLPGCSLKDVITNDAGKLTQTMMTNNTVLNIDGIFAAIGQIPNVECVKDLIDLDERQFIITNNTDMTTKMTGVFAAGDCTHTAVRQVVTACSDGAKAAIAAVKYLNEVFDNE